MKTILCRKTLSFTILLILSLGVSAQNWDHICHSGEYYYGIGRGTTREEATERAMAELVGMIATHVSNEFIDIDDETNINGSIDHKSRVLNCVKTYSQSTLTNVQKWAVGTEPDITIRCYIKKSELSRIYESRIAKAKDMAVIAGEALGKGKIDMALQYYYWAYSLARSVQRPDEVKDQDGHILVNWIPARINSILGDVSVSFEKRDGDFVDLLFNYKGQPVSSLEFNYTDGRTMCQGRAKDGRGMMEMVPGYQTDTYHIELEYEYKGQARGDAEMESVLNVITRKVFDKAAIKVKGTSSASRRPARQQPVGTPGQTAGQTAGQASYAAYAETLNRVITAIQTRNYSNANTCFTLDGLEMYNKLISYGTGRIVGTPGVKFSEGLNGNTVARGLQMSFTFRSGTKKTYVEDVVFSFNRDGKIENVAFGLGKDAENDILCRNASGWSRQAREQLLEFMENYKTAYCLKRLDYIRDIFSDDALIIIGNVVKRQASQLPGERNITSKGTDLIRYNRYTKKEYIDNLAKCFARNEFINIRFSNNEVQWLEKYKDRKLFGIQIGQEYNSTHYADKGYLFLLIDMTDEKAPVINVRTWQPNEVSMDKIYHAGDFYGE